MTIDAALDWAKANMPPGMYLEFILTCDEVGAQLRKIGPAQPTWVYYSLVFEGDRLARLVEIVNAARRESGLSPASAPPFNG